MIEKEYKGKKEYHERAYAKINLILDVLSKREDGYHNIDFVMSTVNIYDTIIITENIYEKDWIEVPGYKNLAHAHNLAYKALKLLKSKYNINKYYKIIIRKKIPIAAGMAGGSSDAAAVLRMINKIENLNLSLQQLADIGSELGSDVSFCVYSQLARVQGTGEKVQLLKNKIPNTNILVVNPGVGLSTQKVYQNHIINKTKNKKNIDDILQMSNSETFYNNLRNDLEETAINIEPSIKKLIDSIEKDEDIFKIMVSGSGPTVLIFSDNKKKLEALAASFKNKNMIVYLTNMNN